MGEDTAYDTWNSSNHRPIEIAIALAWTEVQGEIRRFSRRFVESTQLHDEAYCHHTEIKLLNVE